MATNRKMDFLADEIVEGLKCFVNHDYSPKTLL